LKELLKRKQKGEKIEAPEETRPSKVVNLMDALRKSLEGSGKKTATAARPKSKKSAKTRKKAV